MMPHCNVDITNHHLTLSALWCQFAKILSKTSDLVFRPVSIDNLKHILGIFLFWGILSIFSVNSLAITIQSVRRAAYSFVYLLYFKVKIQPRWWPEGARTGWPAGTDFGRRDFRLRCGATAHPWDWMKYKYKYKREILQYKNFVYETFNVAEAWGHLQHQWAMQMWKKLQKNTI